MIQLEKLEKIYKRYKEIEALLADPDVSANQKRMQALMKEYTECKVGVSFYRQLRELLKQKTEYNDLIHEDGDDDFQVLAAQERAQCEEKIEALEKRIRSYLVPKEPDDSRDVIMEIRAGTGGDEAALFAGDLFRIYTRFIESKGWRYEVLSSSPTGLGGFKEIIFSVKGQDVFQTLKYERGGHRVQRIPLTESGGRIHTSAATVAVLPEVDHVEINIDLKDLRIDVYRASGAGGQHVNKTESAVRITHIPTNTVVQCQDGKSQHQNKAQAMKVLFARLHAHFEAEKQAKRARERKTQIGSGDRNERIRTYNFPQGRITDHRINLTLYNLPAVMEGQIDAIVEACKEAAYLESLEED
ncbi:peptide chain release factor 1 [PVC group bacterium]|nr:peptide chain release factor 1 [PVC group bacterium]